MVRPMRATFLWLLLPACAAAQSRPPASEASVSHLDRGILETATKARQVEKIAIETCARGRVEEISVYHHDEARVPEAVRRLVQTRFPGSRPLSYETEREGDRSVGEVEIVTAEGRRCEVAATDDGTLRYVECVYVRGDLPAAVVSAVDRLLPHNEFVEAEKKEGPDGTTFSVEARVGGVVHAVRLTESGEVRRHAVQVPAMVEIELAGNE
jgi:hypothetical protein